MAHDGGEWLHYILGGAVTLSSGAILILWRNHFAHRKQFKDSIEAKLTGLGCDIQTAKDECLVEIQKSARDAADSRKEIRKELNTVSGDVRVLMDFKKRTEGGVSPTR